MAINRYSQPLDVAIQPIPFNEIAQAGKIRQSRYDQSEAAMNQFVDSLYNLPAATPDKTALDARIAEIEQGISGLVENTPDFGSEEFRRGITDIIRTQSRDRFYKNTAANAAMEAEYRSKLSDDSIPYANRLALMKEYNKFRTLGTKGYGLLTTPTTPEYIDYRNRLSEEGKGFEKQGEKTTINPDGSTTTGWSAEGIDINEVGLTYGYNVKGGVPKFVGIPAWFTGTPEFDQLKRDAIYNLYSKGVDTPNEKQLKDELNNLYEASTKDLVYKYSGLSTEESDTTRAGAKTKQEELDEYRTTLISGNTVALDNRPDSIDSYTKRIGDISSSIKEYQKNVDELPEGSVLGKQYKELLNTAVRNREKMETRLNNIKKDINYDRRASSAIIDFISETFVERDPYSGEALTDGLDKDNKKYIKDLMQKGDWDGVKNAMDNSETAEFIFSDYDNNGKVTNDDILNNITKIYTSQKDIKFILSRGTDRLERAAKALSNYTGLSNFLKDRYDIDVTQDPEAAFEKIDRIYGSSVVAFTDAYNKNIRKINNSINKKLEEDSAQSGKFNSIVIGKDNAFRPILADVERAYEKGKSRFKVFETTEDKDGGYITGDDLPPTIDIGEMSETVVPGAGIVYKASYKDTEGNVRTFNVTTDQLANINDQLYNKYMYNYKLDPTNKKAFQTAMMLKYPLQLPIIQELEPNQSYTFYKGLDQGAKSSNKPVAKITKKDYKGTKYYEIDVLDETGNPIKTVGSNHEFRDGNISALYNVIHTLNTKNVDVNK